MSDSESTAAPPAHPTYGGKSLQSLERPRYKSWRKKYRKMRHDFDGKLEENKRLFKEEHKLEAIAKRLREELDGLLEMCIDLNQNPSIPPELRFDVSLPNRRSTMPMIVPAGITPEAANDLLMQYKQAVHEAHIPPLDLHVVRAQIEQRLAEQDVRQLHDLEATVPCPVPTAAELPDDIKGDDAPGYLTTEQATDYLLRLDNKTGDVLTIARQPSEQKPSEEDKHLADLTPRELERHVELLNPQSQHNWLKNHSKLNASGDVDDTESLASHDTPRAAPRKRGGNKNLAKQVGDRAVERAREGFSPGAASGFEEDDLSVLDEHPGPSSRKRARDPDSTYRVKGGKSGGGGGAKGSKRKRSGEDIGTPGSGSKKARVEGGVE